MGHGQWVELESTMAKIDRFEDFLAWQLARELTRQVYALTRTGTFARDFGLASQIQRAAVSIMSNIAEGFERGKRSEFHQFLCIAKASCAEVRSQLYVALDVGYLDEAQFAALMEKAQRLGRVIGGLRAAVSQQRQTPRPQP